MSKLPAPSVSMPCDYRILQSSTKEQVLLVLLETVQRSLHLYLHVNTLVSTRTYFGEYAYLNL